MTQSHTEQPVATPAAAIPGARADLDGQPAQPDRRGRRPGGPGLVGRIRALGQAPPRQLGRQPALDGLRGLAVVLVLTFHVGLPMRGGGVGVDVFFVLSGFLITTLLLAERERTGTIAFGAFYARRARRLLPALALSLALFALFRLVIGPLLGIPLLSTALPLWKALAAPLLFASNAVAMVGNNEALGALTPTWSLAAEEQFYLLWPLALWLLTRRRERPFALLALLAVVGAGLVYYAHLIPVLHPRLIPYFNPYDRGAELLLGCAASVLWRRGLTPAALRWRPVGWAALALILFVGWRDRLPHGPALGASATWLDTQTCYLTVAAAACVVLLGVLHNPDGDLAVLFSIPPLRYLGRISYGLYLFNLPVISVTRQLLPGPHPLRLGVLAAAVTVGLAAASWRLMESKVLRAGRRTAPAPAVAGTSAAAQQA